ncbi:hypothetical protein [Saccharospirillum sp. MSK14-1]|uniref:hypothetical protein n=1 Tax=Saccharospirillum sp. MSK14-1 TaxID=1897632 RepID=UPI0011B241EB|nr:hypothetical protein [Saccharospirillum sp. MSK14-1]
MTFFLHLRATFRYFREHWLKLLCINVVIRFITIGAVVAVEQFSREGTAIVNLTLLVGWVGIIWVATATIYYINASTDGRKISPFSAIHRGMAPITPVFVLQMLLFITTLILLPFIYEGLSNLKEVWAHNIVYGLLFFLGARLVLLATMDTVIRQSGVMEALRSAWKNSRGSVWILMFAHFIFLAALVGSFAVSFFLIPSSWNSGLFDIRFYLLALLMISTPFLTVVPLYIFVFQVYTHSPFQPSTPELSSANSDPG